jgi:hypothetical protein
MRASFVLFPLLNLSVLVALASTAAADPWPTAGGEPGQTIEVTTLADSGEGSLREALETKGRRTIVFKVAGEIWLDEMLRIRHPFVTVAGETAPSPGITLMGDMVKIRTHDVILRHIRVRVGALPGQSEPRDRDGIQIIGAPEGGDPSYNILIENCSVSWSVDGVLDTYGGDNHDIAIRNSILAEGLNNSIHPEGDHSTGLRIGPNTQDVLIQGNLLAHNKYRNPLIAGGSEVVVANNLIYNPGTHALHFNDHDRADRPTRASVIGNYVIAGPNTADRERLRAFDNGLPEGSEILYEDNVTEGVLAFDPDERVRDTDIDPFVSEPPFWLPVLDILSSEQVPEHVLSNSGARPWDRDEVDTRLVGEVESRTGEIRDEPTDARLSSSYGGG